MAGFEVITYGRFWVTAEATWAERRSLMGAELYLDRFGLMTKADQLHFCTVRDQGSYTNVKLGRISYLHLTNK